MFGGALAGPVFNQVMTYLLQRENTPWSTPSDLEYQVWAGRRSLAGRPRRAERRSGSSGWPVSWADVSPDLIRPSTSGVSLRVLAELSGGIRGATTFLRTSWSRASRWTAAPSGQATSMPPCRGTTCTAAGSRRTPCASAQSP